MIAQRAARTLFLASVLVVALTLIFCGCNGDSDPAPAPDNSATSRSAISSEEQKAEEKKTTALPALSPLTGLAVGKDYQSDLRPYAVVVGNSKQDRPQRGLSRAEVLFEIMEKDGTTDLMALYSSRAKVPTVGPVTAAQDAFAQFAVSVNAIFTHIGGTAYTGNLLNELGYQDIDGIYLGTTAFVFDHERSLPRPGGKLNESCWFTNKKLLKNGVKAAEIGTKADSQPMFTFTQAVPKPSKDAQEIKITFPAAKSGFLYSEEVGQYTKMLDKKAHTDENGNTLTFNNVILLNCTTTGKEGDDQNLDYDLRGGTGYYFNAGNVQMITWRKGAPTEPLQMFNEHGGALEVQAGQSYIGLLNQDTKLTYGRYNAED